MIKGGGGFRGGEHWEMGLLGKEVTHAETPWSLGMVSSGQEEPPYLSSVAATGANVKNKTKIKRSFYYFMILRIDIFHCYLFLFLCSIQ